MASHEAQDAYQGVCGVAASNGTATNETATNGTATAMASHEAQDAYQGVCGVAASNGTATNGRATNGTATNVSVVNDICPVAASHNEVASSGAYANRKHLTGPDTIGTQSDGDHLNGTHVNGNGCLHERSSLNEAHHNEPGQTGITPQVEPLAIIGMACRLPGDVKDPIEFWEMCARLRNGWSEIPASRFNAASFYHPNPGKFGAFNPTGGSFMQQDLALFDAPFFKISSQEAQSLDPQQRILLECAYEALENAGVAKEAVSDGNVGVFIGSSFADYELNNLRDTDNIPMYESTGNAPSALSNRISYFFDLKGPSISVDTACSSSLVALHLACQSLRHGESSQALVGSCHLNLAPENFISMSMSRLFSDSGSCYAFDHKGQSGFGRGDGAGMIVLKRLSDAIEAGDPIRALVVSSGVNQDGATQGMSMPSGAAQERLMRSVYKSAGLDPRDTGFVEAHGTGTKVGDPIEASALHAVFGEGRTKRQPLYVGAVKSNVGHSEGASGIVSVIKTAMILERGFVLPNRDFEKAKENIPLDQWNMKIPVKQVPWPAGKKYASVSSFGYGGTNAHVVLAKAPANKQLSTQPYYISQGLQSSSPLVIKSPSRKVFVLSGNDEQAARTQVKNLEIYCEQNPGAFDLAQMDNLAYTLGQRRSRLNWRVAITASSTNELVSKLSAFDTKPNRSFELPVLGFVFTGQGAQWYAMGRELMAAYPVFADAMLRADDVIAGLGATFSIVKELSKDPGSSLVSAAHISQPACTAVQIALTELLRSWVVRPCAVVGHSSGEIGAAYAAERLSLEDCMSIAYWRGMTSQRLEEASFGAKGAMVAVGAGEAAVAPYLNVLKENRAAIACVNSDASVTISGDEEAIVELQVALSEDCIFNRRLQVGVAYHSHHMKRIAEEYHDSIRHVAPQNSDITFHSSVYGRLANWTELGAEYWVDNLVSPVQFSKGLRDLLENGRSAEGKIVQTLVEVGPHPALEGPIKQTLENDSQGNRIRYIPTLRRKMDAIEAVQQLAGTLFSLGLNIDLGAVNFPVPPEWKLRVVTNLLKYPWTLNKRYWHETRVSRNFLHRRFPRSDILGSLCTESDDIEPRWRNTVHADDLPWIRDHRVQRNIVYPLAGYIAMAIEAATQQAKIRLQVPVSISLREVTAGKALIIPESSAVETVLALRPYAEGTRVSSDAWSEFRVFSWVKEKGWDENCRGLISVQSASKPNTLTDHAGTMAAETAELIDSTEASCVRNVAVDAIYRDVEKAGFLYDGLFRGLKNCHIGSKCTVVDFKVPTTKTSMPFEYETDYILHPTTLDLCFQTVWPLLGAGESGLRGLYMPTFLKSLKISSIERIAPEKALRIYSRQSEAESRLAPINHSIIVVDADDPASVVMRFEDLTMTSVRGGADVSKTDDKRNLCYKLILEPHFDFMNAEELFNGQSSKRPVSCNAFSRSCKQAVVCVQRMICLNPHMSILEIGAGDGAATLPILETLGGGATGKPAWFNRYTYTDSSGDSFEIAKEKLGAWEGLLDFKTLDISADLTAQGFTKNSFDLLVACCPLQTVSKQQETLAHVHSLLKPGGKFLVIDNASQIDGQSASAFSVEAWGDLLHETGFSGVDVHLNVGSDASKQEGSVMVTTAKAPSRRIEEEVVIVCGDSALQFPQELLTDGIEALSGMRPTTASLANVDAKGKLCVVLYEIDGPKLSNLTPELFGALQRMLLSASGVLWVVGEASSTSPESNLITGLARTVRSESGLRFATLDLAIREHVADGWAVNQILRVFSNVFGNARSVLDNGEMEFLVRKDTISVPRIIEDVSAHELVKHEPNELLLRDKTFRQTGRPLKMALDQPGILDTIYFTDDDIAVKPLPEDCIEIQVQYAGLNFKDVMNAMGQLNSDSFGLECSGIVSKVGIKVTDFVVGDKVCAVADGTLASFTRCQATSAWKVPDIVGMEAASTVPIVFCTAYYSLVDVARLQAGERVLIHAAAGGVGQAAMMVAQAIGADVFATVGSIEKKEYLMKIYNIPANRVFFSRDLSFADGIRKATNGTGVDVALNSLAGEALRATWECMAPFGRFIEIGKRDIKRNSRLEMSQFDNNLTFSSVDLMVILRKRPALMKRLLKDVFAMFQSGEVKAVSPRSCYSVSEVHAALSSLQTGRAMGKIAIKMEDEAVIKVNHRPMTTEVFRSDASYVIVGGTGGLGRNLAIWMAENGAKHLVLISRSGGDRPTTQDLVEKLEGKGCRAVVCACDMSSKRSVEEILEPALKALPVVAGAVYGAMVLRDVLFENMTYGDYDAVIKSKVHGVWNLHDCLLAHPLDFFITISSLAGIVGNRGQAAYAATATFMDAFVQYRKVLGLPCSTIDLAPVVGIGYLAENLDKQKIVRDAFGGAAVDEDEIRGLFATAVSNELETTCNGQCITGMNVTEANIDAFWMNDPKCAILKQNFKAAAGKANGYSPSRASQSLADAIKEQKDLEGVKKVVVEGLIRKISAMLMRPEGDVRTTTSLANYGVDSLVAIEFRSWIARELGATLQILEILAADSIMNLVNIIVKRSMLILAEMKTEGAPHGEVEDDQRELYVP